MSDDLNNLAKRVARIEAWIETRERQEANAKARTAATLDQHAAAWAERAKEKPTDGPTVREIKAILRREGLRGND